MTGQTSKQLRQKTLKIILSGTHNCKEKQVNNMYSTEQKLFIYVWH